MVNKSVLPILFRFFLNLAVPPAVAIFSLQSLYHVSPWALLFVAILSIPLAFVIRVQWTLFRDKRAAAALGATLAPTPPGKWPGNLDILVKLVQQFKGGYPGEVQDELAPIVGHTVNLRLLWDNVIFTTEPDNIKAILASDFNNYEKGPQFREFMHSVLGTGVFNADGDMWKFHRAMTRPFFSRDRISHFDLFNRHAGQAMHLVKQRLRAGYSIDFQDIVSRFTLDSATEFLFGHCVDSLSSSLPYPHNVVNPEGYSKPSAAENFARAFLEAQEAISNRAVVGWTWPLMEMFSDRSGPSMKIVDAYLNPILEEALRKNKDSPADEKEKDDIGEDDTLLDHLIRRTSEPVVLHDELLNILVAGRDTTAATLTFVVYLLAMHPDVLSRLREEVLTHVGTSRRPTYDDVRDMKFLRAVINETLRLFPAVPFNQRTAISATTWANPDPNGKPIYIPAGTCIPYSVFLMHRRKDLWGPDADDFDPDRFIDERLKKYLTPKPFIFLPFNAGPRICLGQQFAYNEMSFFLIKLLQTVDSIKLDLDSQSPESRVPESWKTRSGRAGIEKFNPRSHLTMYAHGGLWVKMTEVEAV